MDVREKLVELILNADNDKNLGSYDLYELTHERTGLAEYFADYLIAHGVTVQEWISVKDRLPQEKGETCKNVIMFMDDGLVTVGWLNEDIGFAFYLDTRNDFVSKVPISRCTHWMPLPQPPKGE